MKPMDRILEVAGTSTEGVCENVLLIPILWLEGQPEPSPAPRHHVTITLMNDQIAMHVGLLANWETYSYVVRVMLNMDSNQPLDDQDVTDGIGEMINMVAGQMKTKLNDRYPSLKIGFPTIQTENRSGIQVRSVETASKLLSIGIHDAEVTVMLRAN
jgi:CheY-specific phosphatase CheX